MTMLSIASIKLTRCCPWLATLAGADIEGGEFTPEERSWQQQSCRGREPSVVVRTRTGVDVGHWLGKSPVCAAVTDGELVLFAPGKRPYAERLTIRDGLRDSEYNHITGELMLAPGDSLRVRRLKLSPVAGRMLWEQIQSKTKAGNHD
jgi:hypothetical protein